MQKLRWHSDIVGCKWILLHKIYWIKTHKEISQGYYKLKNVEVGSEDTNRLILLGFQWDWGDYDWTHLKECVSAHYTFLHPRLGLLSSDSQWLSTTMVKHKNGVFRRLTFYIFLIKKKKTFDKLTKIVIELNSRFHCVFN